MNNHILFIVENQAAPYDRRVWLEACAVKENGCDVSIISVKNKKAIKAYEKIGEIAIYRHPSFNSSVGKLGFFIEYLTALFCETILCCKIYWHKPFNIIHSANPPDTVFIIAWLFKLIKVKFIFDHHDLSPELYQAKFKKDKNWLYYCLLLLEKMSCKTADVIITTNESYKKIIVNRHNLDKNRVVVVRNDPVVVTKTNGMTKRSAEKYKKTLLYLGSINKQDGLESLLDAVSILIHKYHIENIVCRIIGDGDDLENIKTKAQELKLNGYVEFTGYIYDKEVINIMVEEADICLEPAPDNEVNRHSTFIKIMEYMAKGKPIIAFDLAETRFSAGEGAVLIKPGAIEEFAEAISKMLKSEELRKELGQKGYERIVKELNWKNSVKNLMKAYKHLS